MPINKVAINVLEQYLNSAKYITSKATPVKRHEAKSSF